MAVKPYENNLANKEWFATYSNSRSCSLDTETNACQQIKIKRSIKSAQLLICS